MTPVLLSVCIPCYNGGEFLRRSVSALCLDSHPNFECVVADNASTDATAEICAELAERFYNFSYLRYTEHVGAIGNFNRCAEQAKGKYIVFLPVDDLLFLDRFVPVIDFLEAHEEVGFSFGSIIGVDTEGRVFAMTCPGDLLFEVCDIASDSRVAEQRIAGGVSVLGLVMRKSLFERLGGLDPDCELFTEAVFPFQLLEASAFLVHRRFLSAFVNRKQSSYSSTRPEFLEASILKLFGSERMLRLARKFPSMYRLLLMDILRGHFRSGPLRFTQVIRCMGAFFRRKPNCRGIAVFLLMLVSSGRLAAFFLPAYQWFRQRKLRGCNAVEEEDLNLLKKAGVCFKLTES